MANNHGSWVILSNSDLNTTDQNDSQNQNDVEMKDDGEKGQGPPGSPNESTDTKTGRSVLTQTETATREISKYVPNPDLSEYIRFLSYVSTQQSQDSNDKSTENSRTTSNDRPTSCSVDKIIREVLQNAWNKLSYRSEVLAPLCEESLIQISPLVFKFKVMMADPFPPGTFQVG